MGKKSKAYETVVKKTPEKRMQRRPASSLQLSTSVPDIQFIKKSSIESQRSSVNSIKQVMKVGSTEETQIRTYNVQPKYQPKIVPGR